jgi:hypothetical protein
VTSVHCNCYRIERSHCVYDGNCFINSVIGS